MGYNMTIPHKNIMKTLKQLKEDLKNLEQEYEFQASSVLVSSNNLKQIQEEIYELKDTITKRSIYK